MATSESQGAITKGFPGEVRMDRRGFGRRGVRVEADRARRRNREKIFF